MDSEAVGVEAFRLLENGHWQLEEYKKPDEILCIHAVNYELSLNELYRDTRLIK